MSSLQAYVLLADPLLTFIVLALGILLFMPPLPFGPMRPFTFSAEGEGDGEILGVVWLELSKEICLSMSERGLLRIEDSD